jgi:hypothetical protein
VGGRRGDRSAAALTGNIRPASVRFAHGTKRRRGIRRLTDTSARATPTSGLSCFPRHPVLSHGMVRMLWVFIRPSKESTANMAFAEATRFRAACQISPVLTGGQEESKKNLGNGVDKLALSRYSECRA